MEVPDKEDPTPWESASELLRQPWAWQAWSLAGMSSGRGAENAETCMISFYFALEKMVAGYFHVNQQFPHSLWA